MDSGDWDKYIEHKIDTSLGLLSEFLDIMYTNNNFITREELSKANDNHITEFKKEVRNIFEFARDIQRKNSVKKKELKTELREKIMCIVKNKGEIKSEC